MTSHSPKDHPLCGVNVIVRGEVLMENPRLFGGVLKYKVRLENGYLIWVAEDQIRVEEGE